MEKMVPGCQKCFLEKARPEWDLRYFSKERAFDRSLKAT